MRLFPLRHENHMATCGKACPGALYPVGFFVHECLGGALAYMDRCGHHTASVAIHRESHPPRAFAVVEGVGGGAGVVERVLYIHKLVIFPLHSCIQPHL